MNIFKIIQLPSRDTVLHTTRVITNFEHGKNNRIELKHYGNKIFIVDYVHIILENKIHCHETIIFIHIVYRLFILETF